MIHYRAAQPYFTVGGPGTYFIFSNKSCSRKKISKFTQKA